MFVTLLVIGLTYNDEDQFHLSTRFCNNISAASPAATDGHWAEKFTNGSRGSANESVGRPPTRCTDDQVKVAGSL